MCINHLLCTVEVENISLKGWKVSRLLAKNQDENVERKTLLPGEKNTNDNGSNMVGVQGKHREK